jgi:type I restriction enzyme M protein
LIEASVVDVMVAVGSNFFYTVTLPCTLWFLDKGKAGTARADKVLFIDARGLYNQIDRAHREWTAEQIGLIASIVRLYRGEDLNGFKFDTSCYPQLAPAQLTSLQSMFSSAVYQDVPGLCKVATRTEIEAQGWSLNPGRYVGVTEKHTDNGDFAERLEELNEELEALNAEARELEERIAENVADLLK